MTRLKFLQKLRCKKQNVKKSKIFWLFWGPCGNSFFTKLHLSPQTTLLDNGIICVWKYLTFWSMKSFRNLTKVSWKREKSVQFELLSFLVANCAFSSFQNFVYFLKKAFLTTNLFIVERLWNFKLPRFSKITQKLHKILKIWIFCVFVNFGQNFMHFFNTNCFYLFKEATTTTILFPTESLQRSKPPSFRK